MLSVRRSEPGRTNIERWRTAWCDAARMDVKAATRGVETATALPEAFARWFAGRGWSPRPFQLALVEAGLRGESVLLTAPTGGGKTLAGFLPSLIELSGGRSDALAQRLSPPPAFAKASAGNPLIAKLKARAAARPHGIHTLYISPLKALSVDVARNLEMPVKEMGLKIRLETRTGDTSAHRRQRQKHSPPDILLTTPEQLALLLATREAPAMFGDLSCVVLDELPALVT